MTNDEGATLTIIPIVRRELMADVSGRRLQSERAIFAALLAAVIVGVFGTWCYSAGGEVTSLTMARMTDNALAWSLICHTALYASVVIRGAFSIARERERRTLDFLLVTRMSSAEIVLGKLAGCLVGACGVLAAGFPIMLLFHVLGGVDLRLLLLADAGFLSTILFFGSWAIWISVEARTGRLAAVAPMLIVATLADRPVQCERVPAAIRHPPARLGRHRERVARLQRPHESGLSAWLRG